MISTGSIGVFDSGLGGLTVLSELVQRFPGEDFVYLGDTARLPYGSRSPKVIQQYALKCVRFLESHQVKCIVVACNTVSSSALDFLRAQTELPIYGVIEPGVKAALERTRNNQVLVLATPSTVRSEGYPKAFHKLSPETGVEQIACPLFVPLVEAGWWDHSITTDTIAAYLDMAKSNYYDVVVLGCTHYPILKPQIERVIGHGIPLVHGATYLADQLESVLSKSRGRVGTIRYFSTDAVDPEWPMVRRLIKNQIGGSEAPSFEWIDIA